MGKSRKMKDPIRFLPVRDRISGRKFFSTQQDVREIFARQSRCKKEIYACTITVPFMDGWIEQE